MARPLRIQYPGAFYHITSRGNERKDIFKNDRDRERFLSYLQSATKRYGATIHAYCLLNNHYHLLLQTPRGNLSEILRHINGAYTTYFNVKRDRSGHLLQGRYKAILVEADEYAKELSRYIHLNPARVGAVKKPHEYPWSSYRDYIGERESPEWLKRDFILGMFGKKLSTAQTRYRQFVQAIIGRKQESPLRKALFSTILGSEEFVRTVTAKLSGQKKADRDLPAIRKLWAQVAIEDIENEARLAFSKQANTQRKVSVHLCHRYTGRTLREIGTYFGLSDSGVTQASRRLEDKMEQDKTLRRKVAGIKGRLNL